MKLIVLFWSCMPWLVVWTIWFFNLAPQLGNSTKEIVNLVAISMFFIQPLLTFITIVVVYHYGKEHNTTPKVWW